MVDWQAVELNFSLHLPFQICPVSNSFIVNTTWVQNTDVGIHRVVVLKFNSSLVLLKKEEDLNPSPRNSTNGLG